MIIDEKIDRGIIRDKRNEKPNQKKRKNWLVKVLKTQKPKTFNYLNLPFIRLPMLKSKAVSKSWEGLPTKRRETVKLLTLINKKNIAMLKKKIYRKLPKSRKQKYLQINRVKKILQINK